MTSLQEMAASGQELGAMGAGEVTRAEHVLNVLGGGALVLYGLSRRSLLGMATAALGGYTLYRTATGHSPVREGVSMVMSPREEPVVIEETITINKPPKEVYTFFRTPENLLRVMDALEDVEIKHEGRFRWIAKPLPGTKFTWQEEIIEDRPSERIVWSIMPGTEYESRARLDLKHAPGNRGTEAKLRFEMCPPGGRVGAAVAGMFDSLASKRAKTYLRQAKQLLETGEIATVEGQASGRA